MTEHPDALLIKIINAFNDWVYIVGSFIASNIHNYFFVPGVIAGFSLVLFMRFENIKMRLFLVFIFSVTVLLQPLLAMDFIKLKGSEFGIQLNQGNWYFYYWLLFFVATFIFLFFTLQYISYLWERLKSTLTIRTSKARRSKIDINDIEKHLSSQLSKYNLLKQIRLKKGVFVGKNRENKNVYLPLKDVLVKHWQVAGTTGSGKTVFLQMMIYQLVLSGVSVAMIDPKQDEHLPYVLFEVAEKAGKHAVIINLVGTYAQWNPFLNKTARQIADLIIVAAKFEDKGGDGDFYAIYCRRLARKFGAFIEGKIQNLRCSICEFISLEAENNKEAAKFFEILDILATSEITNITVGLDLEKEVKAGNPIYFAGSMRDEDALLLQRMAVTSVMQICEGRSANHTEPHISLFLDEFRALISKPTLECLSVIRSKGANVYLAHQTMGDLKQVTADLNPDSVVDNVLENSSYKLIYRIADPETAEAFSKRSGSESVDEEVVVTETNSVLYERVTGVRSLRQTESYLIEPNLFHNLPDGCAVLLGQGKAQYVFTAYVPIDNSEAEIQPTLFASTNEISKESNNTSSTAEALVNVD